MSQSTEPDDGLFAVSGLRGAAVRAGIKASGTLDLAVIVADEPMTAVGVFTTSAVAAAPVQLCRQQLQSHGKVRAIVINSGNANALTGDRGERDARAMLGALETACGGPGLVLSTGVIGVPLPIEGILAGIDEASGALSSSAGQDVARAILTTDTGTKTSSERSILPDCQRPFVVGGVAKGSGMIHPNMATMIAIIATDAPLAGDALGDVLSHAVDHSFHEISVDGDTSTNDSVLLLARAAPVEALSPRDVAAVRESVTRVAQDLAGQIVRDGEGATRLMQLQVCEAASRAEAVQVARSIARSSLVKTALAGGDPNWGRILSAAGAAGVPLSPKLMSLELGGQLVFERGEPLSIDEQSLRESFGRDLVEVRLSLGRGDAEASMMTTDLTKRYVEINSEYTT